MITVTCREYDKIITGFRSRENDNAVITEKHFSDLHQFALSERGREVLTAGTNYVKATNYVGVVQTRSGLVLEILPKIYSKVEESVQTVRSNFIRMLRALRRFPQYNYIDFANLKTAQLPLYEIFISMFINEVFLILKKGIKSNYVSQEENVHYLRGKLVVGEHIRRNSIHKERFYVNYDEYIADIPKNRIIKTALLYLKRISASFENQQKINELLFIFDSVSITINPDYEFNRIIQDRTSDYYNNALAWAMLFLSGKSFATYAGSTIAFALLFPMEQVFESYVYFYLKKYSNLKDIKPQSSKYYLINKEEKQLFQIRPDLIALSNDKKIRFILDTKWKLLDRSDERSKYAISQSDLYQLLSYAKIYEAQENNDRELYDKVKLVLIYPKTEDFSDEIVFNYNDINFIELTIFPFDISRSLDTLKNGTENYIINF